MHRAILLVLFLCLFAPLFAGAGQIEYDAAITQDSVKFSSRPFYAGEAVRVYTDLQNLGAQDISGQVSFYQGPNRLGSQVPFFLRSGGVTQGVWIDWTPGEGTYNIMVKVDTDPVDQNQANNVYITPMMTIAKRPPPPALPVQPSIVQPIQTTAVPTSAPQPSKTSLTQEQSIVKKIAQSVAKKIAPRLPVSPPADRRASAPASKTPSRDQKQQIASQEGSVAPLAQNESQPEPVPVGTVSAIDDAKASLVQDRSLTDGFSQRRQRDPARMFLIVGILVAVCSLVIGGYFLHKSRV